MKEKISSDGNGLFALDIANKNVSGIYVLNISGEGLNKSFKILTE